MLTPDGGAALLKVCALVAGAPADDKRAAAPKAPALPGRLKLIPITLDTMRFDATSLAPCQAEIYALPVFPEQAG